ncbi:MAG: cobalamin B12-binding domain-containing protein [Bacillota bacterium]
MNGKKIWGCTLGNCIHVAGIFRFLELAGQCGYETEFGGAAFSAERIIAAVEERNPDIIALSYRLTPEVAEKIFREVKILAGRARILSKTWIFGGTPPVCEKAAATGLFEAVFNGEETDDRTIRWLKGDKSKAGNNRWPGTLIERIRDQQPYPILRHHFGLPDLDETIEGIRAIAASQALDVISVGPDQNAQEFFFRGEEMDETQHGAGGVPLRKPEDLRSLFAASRCGNYPLLRIYSGTRDLLAWAEMSVKELHNAWAAIPLYWYSVIDGRSKRGLVEAIRENQQAMAWHAARNIPVEVNEAHHWSLRGADDETAVAAAYLAAYNARTQGVKDFILQMMWNTPSQTLPWRDLGKMLAKLDMVETLAGADFRIWRQARAGLASLSPRQDIAKGQLAASTYLSMQLKPHIIHVVGFCEGDHAAYPSDVIESCGLVRGVIRNCLYGLPDMTLDSRVTAYKNEMLSKARGIIDRIRDLGGSEDALADPEILAGAVQRGIMKAPQMMRNALCAVMA